MHSPVPTNITWYFSPSAACTWSTTMHVNDAPFRTSRGFSPIGWMAWSMSGLSLINWRVRSGRSRVWFIPALRATLSIHWRGTRNRKGKRGTTIQSTKGIWATRKKELPSEISLCFNGHAHTVNSGQTHSSWSRDGDFSGIHQPLKKRGFYRDWILELPLRKHFADVRHAVCTHRRQVWCVAVTKTQRYCEPGGLPLHHTEAHPFQHRLKHVSQITRTTVVWRWRRTNTSSSAAGGHTSGRCPG